MRFEPDILAGFLAEAGLKPPDPPFRVLMLHLVDELEFFEIAALLRVDEATVQRYSRAGWRALFPEVRNNAEARAREKKALRFIEAAVFRIDSAAPEIALYEAELTRFDLWLFILRECGALRYLSGGAEHWPMGDLLPDDGPVHCTPAQMRALGERR